ncbi:MAG: HD domain-containing protein [Defluviitaleaceae bacterium]|nr:HD domain-containing protein [Defluviitaleaceae bacterium]MCL2239211.1 HD domain-containing protein [Defluviitaleaceae bacterium]MCL2240320.1 HD domain-containing protein [Defluviitaleaceae bacterium]
MPGKMNPKKPPIAAVIDIDSSELRLHIAQARTHPESEREGVRYLESLRYPLSLGRDTFHAGKMRFDKVDRACEVIKNFLLAAKGYGVRHVRTVANAEAREAMNIDYILDQIKIKTGVNVDLMDDLDEKRLIYKLLSHYAEDSLKQSALMVYIGTGNIGVNLLENGRVPQTWNIPVGSLRMGELFGQLQEYTREFHRLLEEYLMSFTQHLAAAIPQGIAHFIVSGQEIDLIARLTGVDAADAPLFALPRACLLELGEKIKRKTPERIAAEFNLPIEKADALLPAVCIYQNLLALTQAQTLSASRMLPCDAVLFDMLHPKRFAAMDKRLARSTEISVRLLAERYRCNMAHGKQVRDFALAIFDKLKKLHGLGTRDKLLLNVAAILHETGEFVNIRDHHLHSYDIVRASDIVGLGAKETEIVALICRYHSWLAPWEGDACYAVLEREEKVRVSKLVALLKLADALDRSYTQKFSEIDTRLTDGALTITVSTQTNAALEQWAFAEKGQFFAEVFGLKAQLRVRKV